MKIAIVPSDSEVFKEIKEKEKQFPDDDCIIVIGRSEPSGHQPDFDL